MELTLLRSHFLNACTIGTLRVDGKDAGVFTLEDVVREGEKIAGKTAIPAGRYRVVIDHSNRFGRDLPRLLDVPGFTGVRIHPGNTDADTEGCILVGYEWKGGDFIGRSRAAFDWLFVQLEAAAGDIWLTIS